MAKKASINRVAAGDTGGLARRRVGEWRGKKQNVLARRRKPEACHNRARGSGVAEARGGK